MYITTGPTQKKNNSTRQVLQPPTAAASEPRSMSLSCSTWAIVFVVWRLVHWFDAQSWKEWFHSRQGQCLCLCVCVPQAWQLEWFGHHMASAYQTPSSAPYFATISNIAAEPVLHPFPSQAKPAQPLQAPSTQAKRGAEQETHETPGTPRPGEDDEIMQYDETLRAEMNPGGQDGQPESQDTFESAPHESRKDDTVMETAEASSPSSDPEIPEPRPDGRPEAEVPALSKLVAEQIEDGTPGKEEKEQKEQKEQVAVVANVLHGASAETKEAFGGHATAEAAPKRNGKRPKAAAKKSAAMPRKKQGTAEFGPLGVQGQQEQKGQQDAKGVQGPFQPEQSLLKHHEVSSCRRKPKKRSRKPGRFVHSFGKTFLPCDKPTGSTRWKRRARQ